MTVLALLPRRGEGFSGSEGRLLSEAVRVASMLGGEAEALILGPPGAGAGAEGLGRYGVRRVGLCEHEEAEAYGPELFAGVVADYIRRGGYGVVLIAASPTGMDLAPRVAAMLDVPLVTDVTELRIEEGNVAAVRPVYSGKLIATTEIDATPVVASLRVKAFSTLEAPREVEISTVVPRVDDVSNVTRVVERRSTGERDGGVNLSDASVVVSGGRGLQDPSNWHLLEELRDAFGPGAALGATRAVVDAGWRPHSEQVGQTGKTVSPELYVAVGISGAIQHIAGMRTSGTIVAINRDPDAPIFRVADFGIVGDLFEVVPRLAREILAARAHG